MKSYYECKRCFYKCYQLNDMKKHLNKKIICTRTIESFKFEGSDKDLYLLSLIRIKNKEVIQKDDTEDIECTESIEGTEGTSNSKYTCETCNKIFTTKSNLNRHLIKTCKEIVEDSKNIINIIDNSNNSNNSNTNIINLNINLLKSFNDDWSTDHINEKDKLILLLNNSKFTTTLENILENEVNLNVLLDKNNYDNGLVYNGSSIVNMNIKEIVKKTMEKLHNHLCNFNKDIKNSNIYNIDTKIIDNEIIAANNKYNDFKKNLTTQNNVNQYIKDIYDKKIDQTCKKYKEIAIHKEGF